MQRSAPTIKNRLEKIARLPLQIRCEVNKRIRAREYPGATAFWLNNEYAVLKVLEQEFEDAPITEADVEEWRNGGFLEWMPCGDFSEQVHFISEYAADVRSVGLTTDDLFMTVLAHHAQFIRGMELVSDEVASRRMTLVERLTKSVLSLRRSELAEARKEIELGRLELARGCKRAKSESPLSSPSSPALSSPENSAILCDTRPSTIPALKSSESDDSANSVASNQPSEKHPGPAAEVLPIDPVDQVHPVHPVHPVHQVHQVHQVPARGREVCHAGEPATAPKASPRPSAPSPCSAPTRASIPQDPATVPKQPFPNPTTRIGVPSTASPRNKLGLL